MHLSEYKQALDLTHKAKARGGMKPVKCIVVGVSGGSELTSSEITRDKLAAMMWLAYRNADHVVVFLGDEGHRFKQAILDPTANEKGTSNDLVQDGSESAWVYTAKQLSGAAKGDQQVRTGGDEWQKTNWDLLSRGLVLEVGGTLEIINKHEFFRWNQMKEGANKDLYEEAYAKFRAAYYNNENPEFRNKVDESIDDYLKRQSSKVHPSRFNHPRELSLEYHLEEAAVYTVLCTRYPDSVMFYKGTELPLFSWLRGLGRDRLEQMGLPPAIADQGFKEITLDGYANPQQRYEGVQDFVDKFRAGSIYYDLKARSQDDEGALITRAATFKISSGHVTGDQVMAKLGLSDAPEPRQPLPSDIKSLVTKLES